MQPTTNISIYKYIFIWHSQPQEQPTMNSLTAAAAGAVLAAAGAGAGEGLALRHSSSDFRFTAGRSGVPSRPDNLVARDTSNAELE